MTGSAEAAHDPHYAAIDPPGIGSGHAVSVSEGVRWAQMPMPGPLTAVNVWLLEDGDGWTVVDTGLYSSESEEAWHTLNAGPLAERPIRRVLLTHMHPDHAGMAGWLIGRSGAPLWMPALEYLTLRTLMQDVGGAAPTVAIDFFHAAGMGREWLDDYRGRFGNFGKMVHPLPPQFRAIHDGDTIRIGRHDWHCVIGRGHSPEHACLYCPDLKLFLAGDQVLPHISPNVSVHPMEPDADPLTQWLDTLAGVRRRVPDDVLVLPGHGRPFHGLHARIDRLIEGHEAGLARLHALLATPHRACDVFGALFHRVKDEPMTQMLAVGEALAHLACLRTRGLATDSIGDDGVVFWRATGGTDREGAGR